MKHKDKQALKSLSPAEMHSELRLAREKKNGLLFKHAAAPLANPLELRALRRKIAILETFIKQKENTKQEVQR